MNSWLNCFKRAYSKPSAWPGRCTAWHLVLWASKISQGVSATSVKQEHSTRDTRRHRVFKRELHSSLSTWVLIHPHTARWTPQNSHNAGYSGRGLDAKWGNPDPEGCCRQSAAPCHWCSHWRGCRSCLLFLRGKKRQVQLCLAKCIIRWFQLQAEIV